MFRGEQQLASYVVKYVGENPWSGIRNAFLGEELSKTEFAEALFKYLKS